MVVRWTNSLTVPWLRLQFKRASTILAGKKPPRIRFETKVTLDRTQNIIGNVIGRAPFQLFTLHSVYLVHIGMMSCLVGFGVKIHQHARTRGSTNQDSTLTLVQPIAHSNRQDCVVAVAGPTPEMMLVFASSWFWVWGGCTQSSSCLE